MAENLDADDLLQILNQLPSVPWSARLHSRTMESEWIYLNPRMAELYGMTHAGVLADPRSLMERVDPEDGARLNALLMGSLETLAPVNWTGRIRHATGEIGWIETQIVFRREADGWVRSYGQAFDVTARMRAESLHRQVLDVLPAGVVAMTPDGKIPVANRASRKFGGGALNDDGSDVTTRFALFETDGVTPIADADRPLVRAARGEDTPVTEVIIRNSSLGEDLWVHVTGTAIRDEAGRVVAGLVVFHDITALRNLDRELRASNERLAASEAEKSALIERLRYSIDELTNPILEVWDDVLVMPVIGVIDSRRAADMVQRLLVEVARTQASFVIVDLTGVEVVDDRTADHLLKLVHKVELVGARCVLTGLRAAVSEALVDLGVDFARITTLRNLKHGLREALRLAPRDRGGLPGSGRGEEPRLRPGSRPLTR